MTPDIRVYTVRDGQEWPGISILRPNDTLARWDYDPVRRAYIIWTLTRRPRTPQKCASITSASTRTATRAVSTAVTPTNPDSVRSLMQTCVGCGVDIDTADGVIRSADGGWWHPECRRVELRKMAATRASTLSAGATGTKAKKAAAGVAVVARVDDDPAEV